MQFTLKNDEYFVYKDMSQETSRSGRRTHLKGSGAVYGAKDITQ